MNSVFYLALLTCTVFSSPSFADSAFRELPYDMVLPDALRDTVALTFDDAPDDTGHTDTVLDVLAIADVPATFFINTAHHTDVAMSARAKATLQRILREGHTLANHTAHHLELRDQSDAVIAEEIDSVQRTLDEVLGEDAPRLTLMRAPYGRPFYPYERLAENNPEHFERAAKILSTRAVHVGWNIDPCDWDGKSVDALVARVRHLLDGDAHHAPQRGIMLLHSNQRVTAAALPQILQLFTERNIRIVSVEDYL